MDPTSTSSGEPTWPALPSSHPLLQLAAKLPESISEAGWDEVWGVTLEPGTVSAVPAANEEIAPSAPSTTDRPAPAAPDAPTTIESSAPTEPPTPQPPFHTLLILQKFLRANENDVEKAATQLTSTLKWRKEFGVKKIVEEERFDERIYGGLGYVTVIPRQGGEKEGWKEVVTWNIYGAVQDKKATFGDLDTFVRWRVALMELSLHHLSLQTATVPIPDYGTGPDPYQMTQIHDYLNVSFLRMDPSVKAASQKTIALFQAHYPELLSRKFFVNVPYIMGWLFTLMKTFMAKETARKLTMMSHGEEVAVELGSGVPTAYGGTGAALEEVGESVKLVKTEVKIKSEAGE
ncbi:MAG: Non-classical phosphatidylinositol transfer protein (PITP) [Chaenotheca gracillima]|nr:MAG: Non-classical phosphatidylinositol transfer protein (PITP) [Chaenotheca gracillima]